MKKRRVMVEEYKNQMGIYTITDGYLYYYN